jgi:hypothetical protein
MAINILPKKQAAKPIHKKKAKKVVKKPLR